MKFENKKDYVMKSVLLVILVIFFPCFPVDNTYECIGLGETCTVGAALQAFELRKAAYPFDWIISPYASLCSVLEQNFQDFLNPSYLSVRSDKHGIINKYGLVFVHDFPTIHYLGDPKNDDLINENVLSQEWIKFLPDIQEKYDRRIERLRDTCMSSKKIYFIRHGGIRSRDEACILRNILKTTYPSLDFTLVIVGNNSYFAEQWEEQNIKNYHLKDTGIWNDVAEWKAIFVDLGLIISSNETNLQKRMDHYYEKYRSYLEKEHHNEIKR